MLVKRRATSRAQVRRVAAEQTSRPTCEPRARAPSLPTKNRRNVEKATRRTDLESIDRLFLLPTCLLIDCCIREA